MQISQLSEDDILAEITPILPVGSATRVPSGDDSAVMRLTGELAVSTDMLIEGQHFRRDWSTGVDVGVRSVMQNCADVVAMGARPISLVISLGLPPDLEVTWVRDFAQGLRQACTPIDVGIDGGDLVRAEHIAIGVTVLGDMDGFSPVCRRGAQIGDRVIHAGHLGHARAGYELLQAGFGKRPESDSEEESPALLDTTTEQEYIQLIELFRRPAPPLEEALVAARSGTLTAMMDVSDGLIRDAKRLARASGVWIDIHQGADYRIGDLARAAGRLRASRREWALTGGEDHGFLATIPADAPTPRGFHEIGLVRGAAQGRVTVLGREVSGLGGWDHFSSEPGA
ncbi:thiamine-phosphate kinase [Trueperella sp. LYQ141]|uniref:thiamine-phosphate kinase n=1 Tax=Trueperella sp. LYQ141 TaxID=3391058 RepID=UPI0039838030